MNDELHLEWSKDFILSYKEPFSFEKTFYDPSRYETNLEKYSGNKYHLYMRFESLYLGLKFQFKEDRKLHLTIYSLHKLDDNNLTEIVEEIKDRFSLEIDHSEFYNSYSTDQYLKHIIQRNWGKHLVSIYSLYENLIISVFLQNTTIQRTKDMTCNMLSNFGTILKFSDIKLFAMWTPYEFKASSEELRALKVGYRDKNILRITQDFIDKKINEKYLRSLTNDLLEKELLKIFGVGKQTVFYSMLGQFHRTNYLKHIPLWERKILSKYLFDSELCDEREMVDWFHERYGNWCGFALAMVVNDIFYQHKLSTFVWMKKILREK